MTPVRRASLFGLTAALTALCGALWAQQPPAPPRGPMMSPEDMAILQNPVEAIREVKPNLYMVTGAGGNVTVRVTDAGVLLVDSKNPGDDNYQKLIGLVHGVSKQDIKVVVLTHDHDDHAGNSGRFIAAGAKVIGHSNMAARMKNPGFGPPGGRPPGVPPNAPYSGDSTVVKLGGAEARVYHFAPGHTDNDSVVYFPDLKTVATGDLYVSVTPAIVYPSGGSLLGTREAITDLLKLDFDTVIPGHGMQPVSRDKIEQYKRGLDLLISRATVLVKQGVPKDELLSRIKSDDLGWSVKGGMWGGPNQIRLYDELAAAPAQ